MQKQSKIRMINLLCLLGLFLFPMVAAAESDAGTGEIAYSVQKISPEGEADASSPFYDLAVKPGDKREIEARIINTASEPITVESKLFAAYTNSNGEISYTSQAEEYDDSLQYKMNEIAAIQASDIKAEIPANGEKIVKAVIQVPEEAKDGVILGSWYFEKAGQEEQQQETGKGIQIKNKYSYALAIKMTVNKEIDQPNLNLTGITAGLSEFKKAFFANFQNDQPAVMSELSIDAQVLEKGKFDVLYKNNSEGLIMAPNSNFSYPVYLGQDTMRPGDYTMKIKVTTKDRKWDTKTWEWSEDFTVTADEAKKNNEEAINDPKAESINIWWIIGGILLLLLIVALIVYLIMKRRNEKEKARLREEARRAEKKRKRKRKKRPLNQEKNKGRND